MNSTVPLRRWTGFPWSVKSGSGADGGGTGGPKRARWSPTRERPERGRGSTWYKGGWCLGSVYNEGVVSYEVEGQVE